MSQRPQPGSGRPDPPSDRRRGLPAVDRLLDRLGPTDAPRPVVVAIIRRELAALRRQLRTRQAGNAPPDLSEEAVLGRVKAALAARGRARLQPVINGTGVLLHTNLGRAPLSQAAAAALATAATRYSNLEFDLATGRRGARGAALEADLALLCRAEAATVVNNCAAALVLILRHFAGEGDRREVVISRGELVQIGGGFRLPEILSSSGARLREVGTTNRTVLADYARALGPATALLLRVHRSNFFMDGFVESPDPRALAALARKHRVPFVEDLGSGAVAATESLALGVHEPTPAEVLRSGAHLVCFSGDKLLGGPQAGVIAGKRRLVQALKRNPLFRALRCDKLTFAALQATVDAHLDPADDLPPALARLRIPEERLRRRAEDLAAALAGLPVAVSVAQGRTRTGGGTLPRASAPSVCLDLRPKNLSLAELATRLRQTTPPVIGQITNGRFRLDLRTIAPEEDAALRTALRGVLNPGD